MLPNSSHRVPCYYQTLFTNILTIKGVIMTTKDKLSLEITQVPSSANSFTAIVQATQCTAGSCITDFAIADSTDTGSQVPRTIIEHARTEAITRVQSQRANSALSPQQSTPPPAPSFTESIQPHAQASPPRTYRHSQNKPASHKQISSLEGLAARKGTTLNAVSMEVTYKPPQDLSSYDADLLFKHFKAN